MAKNVTFDDIAKYTHFSKTTISRYFNNPESLTPQNQEKIRQALIDLDYKENKVAQILAKGETEFVGVIMPNLYQHYFSEMLNQILLTYEEFGYKFLVFVGGDSLEIEKRYINELLSYKIEGLIVMSNRLPSQELASLPVPIVGIEREDRFISSVNCDNYAGAIKATSLLGGLHCDVLLHINVKTPKTVPAFQRVQGFEDFCKKNGYPYEIMFCDNKINHRSSMESLQILLERIEEKYPDKKKGIFFSDDTRANIFLNLLVRRYHTLPDNYKIVGFDNSPISEESIYTLTTVGQQIDRIARTAVNLLIRQIQECRQKNAVPNAAPVHKVIMPILYERETTSPLV